MWTNNILLISILQLGAKKTGGLGAQKAKKTFAEIEKEAEIADQMKVRIEEERQADEAKRVEDEATATANMKLAYQVCGQPYLLILHICIWFAM